MNPFLSVYGSITIDWIISLEDFPRMNTSADIVSKSKSLGGTAANVAVTASALGVPTALCTFIGDDFPKEYREFMGSKGLILDELIELKGQQSSTAYVVNDSKLDQKVLFYQGPPGHASEFGIELTENALKSKFVHFCTGDPKYHLDMMKKVRNGDNLIAFDPAQEIHRLWNDEMMKIALERSDLMFCNRFEAESMLKYLHVDSFSELNFPFVLCTKGSDGSELYLDGRKIDIPVIKADKVVDATGAGDSFRAGFYAGQYRGLSIEESIITGAATASFIVEKVGALTNIPTWDQVMERADRVLLKV